METLVGVFRCFLPYRYWGDSRHGAVLSALATAGAGVLVGIGGLFDYMGLVNQASGNVVIAGGGTRGDMMGMGVVSLVAFFLITPLGWLADYLFLTAVVRGISLAVDQPMGDPILTIIDYAVRDKTAELKAKKEAEAREAAEGPEVPDKVLECRKFAGKEADYVVVASRRKSGWTAATTVVADSVRLRVGDVREITIEGRLRTCYPLKIIRDLQVDRRIVHYQWPKDMPPIPGLDTDSGVWSPPKPQEPEA
jgi:hypothetical protein